MYENLVANKANLTMKTLKIYRFSKIVVFVSEVYQIIHHSVLQNSSILSRQFWPDDTYHRPRNLLTLFITAFIITVKLC